LSAFFKNGTVSIANKETVATILFKNFWDVFQAALGPLAVWWLRPGIGLERIWPGHPEQIN